MANANIVTYLRLKEDKDAYGTTKNSIEIQNKKFYTDYVFKGPDQSELYKSIHYNIIEKCIQGYNCTVFAYGQTGSGKTYTIQGTEENPGLVYRTLGFLHERFKEIKLSFIEIHNENMIDLYDPENGVSIREDPIEGVKLDNLSVITSSSIYESLSFYEKGVSNRKTACTQMNENSSRSHSILTISLEFQDKSLLKKSKLCFVDLAGSEKIRENESERMKETCNINTSLLCLGKIVHKLGTNDKWHVSYRDSKLTFLLKDSLGGNCRLAIIGNVNLEYPAETINTLQFLSRSKMITNNPSINYDVSKVSVEELTHSLQRLEEENNELREEVSRLRAENQNSIKNSLIFLAKQIRVEAEEIKSKFSGFVSTFYKLVDDYFDENRRLILKINENVESINSERKENIKNVDVKRRKTDQ